MLKLFIFLFAFFSLFSLKCYKKSNFNKKHAYKLNINHKSIKAHNLFDLFLLYLSSNTSYKLLYSKLINFALKKF